ncbi:alpha/beta hydrolase [uncultured Veillonella sp.]|uniref:alpha/beta hydrolase n=1 Tax=uncultured Veillonella sp. TaxID=159268 RepID=UPI00262C5D5A|nr:alpha/beta hydrolase [uncultured Veillonella sp.]
MKVNISLAKKIAVTALAAFSLVTTSLAAPLVLPSQGLVLQGDKKQTYINTEIQHFFKTMGANFTKFEMPTNWTQGVEMINNVRVEHYALQADEAPVPNKEADSKGEQSKGAQSRGEESKGAQSVSMVGPESDRVVLQLHGGAYVAGMSDAHRVLAMKIGTLLDADQVYSVDYRLAPAHVYPAALDDAVEAYKGLLDKGINPNHLIVVGDSAGGNLALALSLYLKEHNMPQPGALLLASPWTDFEHKDNTSRITNDSKDQVLGLGTPLNGAVKNPVYVGDIALDDPRLSPIYADLSGLPPMLIQTGGNELFVTENEALAAKATSDGVIVTFTVYPGMPHDFALLLPEMDDSVQSLVEMRDFVNRNVK